MSGAISILIRHQAWTFAFLGVVAALVIIWAFQKLRAAGLLADSTFAESASAHAARRVWIGVAILVIVVTGSLGYIYGHSSPVSPTALLDFPDLLVDHHGHKLVMFIHGWRGDPQETWLMFPHLVGEDVNAFDLDVLSIGYPTYIVQRNLTMDQFGSWVADRLIAKDMGHYRKIVIIAHSIGGLIARRILVEKKPELTNVVLLVEIASPHKGPQDYAQLLKDLMLPGGALIADLKPGSHFLTTLNNSWQTLPGRPHTYCEASPDDRLVSIDSALDGCDEKHFLPSYDHRGLAKPGNRNEDRFYVPMHTVWEYLKN
jgi:pimeloyl-ACP methyl ester carboxylesterase